MADPDIGTIATFDSTSDVYVLRFDATQPGPAPPAWPQTGKEQEG